MLGTADNQEGLMEKERESGVTASLVDIIQRSSIIAQRRLTEYNFTDNPPDVVIDPPLSNIKVLDFHRGESIIDSGRRAAEKAIPELRNILKRAATL